MALIIPYDPEPNSFVDLKLRMSGEGEGERKERETEVAEGDGKMEIQVRNTKLCVAKTLLIASRQLSVQKRMSN